MGNLRCSGAGPPFALGHIMFRSLSILGLATTLLPACAQTAPVEEPSQASADLALVALEIDSPGVEAQPMLLTPIGEEARVELGLPDGGSMEVAVRVAVVEDSQQAKKVFERWQGDSTTSDGR